MVGEDSLKTEAAKVRKEICQLLQAKASIAGIHVLNFEFKELSYAPEIAASMLVRQQAEAMLEARQVVVEGGVRIAYEAITHLKSAGTGDWGGGGESAGQQPRTDHLQREPHHAHHPAGRQVRVDLSWIRSSDGTEL